jgi:hypothetical protein
MTGAFVRSIRAMLAYAALAALTNTRLSHGDSLHVTRDRTLIGSIGIGAADLDRDVKAGSTLSPSSAAAPVPRGGPARLCTCHNPTEWHPLVKHKSDRSINWTFRHHRGDDRRALDALFGPPHSLIQSPD